MTPDEMAIAEFENDGAAADLAADLVRTRAGVALNFEHLFQSYHPMVFQMACRILGDREEALDVSQEVFLTVYRKLNHFRGESSVRTWIYRIAVNRAANRRRWWSRLRRRGTVSLDEHLSKDEPRSFSDVLESSESSPEDMLLAADERRRIEHCLLRLPIHQRIAVIMRDIEGLSYEEIAESTQVSLGTVKSRIARGREELKSLLNGSGAVCGRRRR
jgi:RNA polymerase sigma-70 factor (ECF subfamily)